MDDIIVRYVSADTGEEIAREPKGLYAVGALFAFSASRDYLIPWHRITSVEGPIDFPIFHPIR